MPLWPIIGSDGFARPNGEQGFFGFGGSYIDASEDEVEHEVRGTYTASDLRVFFSDWVDVDVPCQFRINGSGSGGDGNQLVTATAIGLFQDDTGTDALVSGDLISLDVDQSAGMHGDSFTVASFQITLEASGDSPPIMTAGGGNIAGEGQDWAVTGLTTEYGVMQSTFGGTAETAVEYTMRSTRTLTELRFFCNLYSGTAAPAGIRKNGIDGNLGVSINGTGEFLDSSANDTFVSGDEVNYFVTNADMTSAMATTTRSVVADSSAGLVGFFSTTINASTNYFNQLSETTTEAEAEVEAEDIATIQNLFVDCNTFAETRTIRTRKNGSDGNLSVVCDGLGVFEDETGADSLVADDVMAIQQDAGTSGTNAYHVVVEWETAIAEDIFQEALVPFSEPLRRPLDAVAY